VSTYVLMRILESAPSRYDLGIRMLTFGKLGAVYDELMTHIVRGQKVLDIGCGTGTLSLRAARKGAIVKGIDINPEMLEVARRRADGEDLRNVAFEEMGVAELEKEESDSYDAVTSGLCFSELSQDEIAFTLKEAMRILKLGGLLCIADEVLADNLPAKVVQLVVRIPLVVLTYLLTQTTTHAVRGLDKMVTDSEFELQSSQTHQIGTLLLIVARKPDRGS